MPFNKEIYSNPYYFFLKKKGENYSLYFSAENTLTEARKKDEVVSIPKNKLKKIAKYIKDVLKKGDKKSTKEIKGELEELVNMDGSLANSNIPIHNPNISPKKTMDQTVSTARITNDPISRGYRTYYGESIDEVDMSGAFGYEETEDMNGRQTFKFLVDKMGLDPDEAKERTKEMGKDPSGKKDKKSKYYNSKNFVTKATLSEIQREKMIKMLEDMLVNKKNADELVKTKKETSEQDQEDVDYSIVPKIIEKNIKTLIKQAERHGISKEEILKMFSDE